MALISFSLHGLIIYIILIFCQPMSNRGWTLFFLVVYLLEKCIDRKEASFVGWLLSVCVHLLHFVSVRCVRVCLHECTSIYSSSPP